MPDEIESMVLGMYERTKEQDISLDELFDKYLIPFVLDGKLSKKEFAEVFEVWMKHALENYPDVKIDETDPRVKKIIDSI